MASIKEDIHMARQKLAANAPDKVLRTQIDFESPKVGRTTVTVEGLNVRHSPEKILQLMDLLDLPKGTKATVTMQVASSIVR